jgi:hypothetical protein
MVLAPHQWEPKPLQSADGWAPLASIVDDYDPAVDYRNALSSASKKGPRHEGGK